MKITNKKCILTKERLLKVIGHFTQKQQLDENIVVGFDTETTGLLTKKDQVFLISFGYAWVEENERYFADYAININEETRSWVNDLLFPLIFYKANAVWIHNAMFDIPILKTSKMPYLKENILDSKILARFVVSNKEFAQLSLKKLATKYISADAAASETEIKTELQSLTREHNKQLDIIVKKHQMSKGAFNDIVNEITFTTTDLPVGLADDYEEFLKIPKPNYSDVNRDLMITYACLDVYWMLKIVVLFLPIAHQKKQVEVIMKESRVLFPYMEMEEFGIYLNVPYLLDKKQEMIEYLKLLRNRMSEISGVYLKEGQHKEILKVLYGKFQVVPVDKKTNKQSASKLTLTSYLRADNKELVEYIGLLLAARTCSKWITTYIKGLLNRARNTGIYHPRINTIGAISGRVSGEFQQMPKEGFKEIFSPRQSVIVPPGYDKIVYFDWSQIELRVQAHYILDIGITYCKLPKCYDPNNPIDLHSENVKVAFPYLDENSPQFKKLRSASKTINFASLYGGGLNSMLKNPGLIDFKSSTITKIFNAFKANFVGVKEFNRYVERELIMRGYVVDPYGRRYFAMEDENQNYKVSNHIIQGTCASLLKDKVLLIRNYLLSIRAKSFIQFTLHDEIQLVLVKGEDYLIPHIKQIMEDVPWSKIPIICDVEYTKTNWSEKIPWKEMG